MKSIWITALALIVGVLGSPLAAAGPDLQIENRQFRNESFVLPDLLHAIKSQTGAIGQSQPLLRTCSFSTQQERPWALTAL